MHESGKIRKIDGIYLLAYILIPCAVLAVAFFTSLRLIESASLAAMFVTALLLLAFLWWSYLGNLLYDRGERRRLGALEDAGFVCNHTFTGSGSTVSVDLVHGKVALLFRWNPGETFVRPAGSITKVWVDDGCGGPGFLNGTSRVSFLFTIDGVTVRVDTFRSNKRWSPVSGNVLTAISKADVMVEVLNTARGQVV